MKKNSNSLSKSSLPLNTDRKATIKKYPDIITFPIYGQLKWNRMNKEDYRKNDEDHRSNNKDHWRTSKSTERTSKIPENQRRIRENNEEHRRSNMIFHFLKKFRKFKKI